jgi:hypothetical protein
MHASTTKWHSPLISCRQRHSQGAKTSVETMLGCWAISTIAMVAGHGMVDE